MQFQLWRRKPVIQQLTCVADTAFVTTEGAAKSDILFPYIVYMDAILDSNTTTDGPPTIFGHKHDYSWPSHHPWTQIDYWWPTRPPSLDINTSTDGPRTIIDTNMTNNGPPILFGHKHDYWWNTHHPWTQTQVLMANPPPSTIGCWRIILNSNVTDGPPILFGHKDDYW